MNDASKLVYLAVICFSFSACRLFNNVSDLDEISDQKNEFVYVEDGVFKLKGEEFSFFGSNFYRLALGDAFQSNVIKEYRDGKPFFPQIDKVMENYATEGVKVVRMWGFSCEGSMPLGKPPLLKNDFTLDHTAWEQLDFVIDSAGRHGLRIILPLVNFEHEYCGMQWWVDNTAKNIGNPSSQGFTKSCYDKGSHRLTKVVWNDSDCGPNSEAKFSKEQFYTNNAVWEKYSTYLTTILNRENPYNGLPLKDNPTILAIEVANEPHTSDSMNAS